MTAVHKANNFILTDAQFPEAFRSVAPGYPAIELKERIVDATAALLVRDASRFDVICSTNFYCDILSDLAAELSGSLGLAGSINANERQCAARAQHGSAPDIAGRDIANPTSLILSAAMMLDWYAERRQQPVYADAARAIQGAIQRCLERPATRTADVGGSLGTRAFTDAVVRKLGG